jgi:hypothetical protein
MLALRSECLPKLSRSVPRPTARRFIEQQNSLAPRFALLLSVSSFVRSIRNPLSGPVATGAAPLLAADFKWLLYVNSMILKDKMALFGQIWAQRQTHPGAQFCTIPHNRTQLEP